MVHTVVAMRMVVSTLVMSLLSTCHRRNHRSQGCKRGRENSNVYDTDVQHSSKLARTNQIPVAELLHACVPRPTINLRGGFHHDQAMGLGQSAKKLSVCGNARPRRGGQMATTNPDTRREMNHTRTRTEREQNASVVTSLYRPTFPLHQLRSSPRNIPGRGYPRPPPLRTP